MDKCLRDDFDIDDRLYYSPNGHVRVGILYYNNIIQHNYYNI